MIGAFGKLAVLAGGGWMAWGKWVALALIVAASYYWTFSQGKSVEQAYWKPLLITEQRDFKDFRIETKHLTALALVTKKSTQKLYDAERVKEKLKHELEITYINNELNDYESQRLRDANIIRTSSSRIYSLNALLEKSGESNGSAELAARLEFVNQGFARIAHRGNLAIQRTIQCKREINLVPNLVLTE